MHTQGAILICSRHLITSIFSIAPTIFLGVCASELPSDTGKQALGALSVCKYARLSACYRVTVNTALKVQTSLILLNLFLGEKLLFESEFVIHPRHMFAFDYICYELYEKKIFLEARYRELKSSLDQVTL